MRDFKKLKVWERSHLFTLGIYRETSRFPREELYGLTSQIRRSSSSIPMNLAEGCGRSSAKERVRFFDIAFGSACEAEYQLILAKDLTYLNSEVYQRMTKELTEIKRMLASLIKTLKADV